MFLNDVAQLAKAAERGMRFCTVGADAAFMMQAIGQIIPAIEPHRAGNAG